MAKLTKLEKLTAKLKDVANDIVACDASANERWDALHDGVNYLVERSRQCWIARCAPTSTPPGYVAKLDDPDADLI